MTTPPACLPAGAAADKAVWASDAALLLKTVKLVWQVLAGAAADKAHWASNAAPRMQMGIQVVWRPALGWAANTGSTLSALEEQQKSAGMLVRLRPRLGLWQDTRGRSAVPPWRRCPKDESAYTVMHNHMSDTRRR